MKATSALRIDELLVAVANLRIATTTLAKYLPLLALLSASQRQKVRAAVVKAQAVLADVLEALA